MKRLNNDFFALPATLLAPALIGKWLCYKKDNKITRLRITQTECYYGFQDSASHAHKGKTLRNAPMFEQGGWTYIYLCYGMYDMLNVVSGAKDNPEAVLIRGVEGYEGPGKLTKHLGITRKENCIPLATSSVLWIEDDGKHYSYEQSKRIGIAYAEEKDRNRLWRYCIKF